MKISLSTHQFFDDEGRPLASGRVTVYLHDSDVMADLYTMDGDDYVQAGNPVTCSEDGRIPTLFFDAAVVDVKVEKSNLDGTYELLDTFQDGFDVPDVTNDTVVDGIEALKGTNPEVGVVSVHGYDSGVHAPMRTYVWDPTCTELADDGVIVESVTTDTGRWILLWDDEKLPCTVYGIVPGHEANISAFLTYPDFVGQWSIRTPRIPRFLSGTYTSSTTFTAARTLYFDDGAKFLNATFNCHNAIVPSNSDYVADFLFTRDNVAAHSSWFRSAQWFFRCGAKSLYIDEDNHFANTALTTVCSLNGVSIYGASRIPLTYSNGAYLNLNACSVQGTKVFDPSIDVLRFGSMKWDDAWWTSRNVSQFDFGQVSQGHRLQFLLTMTGNSMDLDSCSVPEIWLKRAKYELEQFGSLYPSLYELDLRGRTVSTVNGKWTTLRNLRTSNLVLAASLPTVLEDVYANEVYCTGDAAVTATRCTLVFGEKFHGDALVLTDCNVRGTVLDFVDVSVTQLSVRGGIFGSGSQVSRVRLPDHTGTWNLSNYRKTNNVSFRDCVLGAPVQTCGPISVENCRVNQAVELFPWYIGGQWVSQFSFKNNTFYDAARVTLDERSYIDASHVNGVTMTGVVTGNSFGQTDPDGFRIRLMDDQAGLVYFLGPQSYLAYHGNTGTCPVELSGRTDYWDSTEYQFGNILEFPNSKYRNLVERVAGLIYNEGSVYATTGYGSHCPLTWSDGGTSGDENEVRHIANPTVGNQRDNIRLMYMPVWFAYPGDENNDMFKVVLACGSNRNPPGWIRWLG